MDKAGKKGGGGAISWNLALAWRRSSLAGEGGRARGVIFGEGEKISTKGTIRLVGKGDACFAKRLGEWRWRGM